MDTMFMGSEFVLLVGGIPGTGKTTIGSILAEELSCAFQESSELAIRLNIASRDPSGRHTLYLSPKMLSVLANAIVEIARKAGCVVVSTVYPEALIWHVESYTPFIVILRTNPLILEKRLSKRGWPRSKIVENLIAESTNYYTEKLWERRDMVIEFDTTYSRPRAAALEILRLVEAWNVGFHIDWLSDPQIVEKLAEWMRELDSDDYRLP